MSWRIRIAAHSFAGLIAAVAGVLLVWFNGAISPSSIGVGPAIDILIIAIIGGLRHPIGPFIGALIYAVLSVFAMDLIEIFVDRQRFKLVIGIVFLLIVLFSPDGVLGIWSRLRERMAASRDWSLNELNDTDGPANGPRDNREERMLGVTRRLLVMAAAAGLMATHPAAAQDKGTLKIGGLATLEGVFAVPGQDGMRGIEAALKEANYTAGGYKLEFIKGSSDASPDSALRAARKLVEQDKVAILVGPLSGSEGLAIKDYAKTQPATTFINGTSAAQDTTLRDPAPNFFRFWTEGAQWMYGLGDYLVKEKKWKKVATIGEDYSFMHTQFFGFALPYCNAGGKIAQRFWVPLGTKDYSSIISSLPDRCRRDLARPWRRRCGELPQSISAGRRLDPADRRFDHGRSVDHQLERPHPRRAERHALRRSPGRYVGQCGLEQMGEALSGELCRKGPLPDARPVRHRLLHRHQGHDRGVERRQGRSVRRPEGAARLAVEGEARHAGRADHAG